MYEEISFIVLLPDTAHIQYGTLYILYININDLSLVIVVKPNI